MNQIGFLIRFIALTAILYGVIHYSGTVFSKNIEGSYTLPLLFYFMAVTLAFHFGLQKRMASDPKGYIRFFMAGTTIKLLMHVIVIALYCSSNKETAIPFVMNFLLLYVGYLIFETFITYQSFQAQKKARGE